MTGESQEFFKIVVENRLRASFRLYLFCTHICIYPEIFPAKVMASREPPSQLQQQCIKDGKQFSQSGSARPLLLTAWQEGAGGLGFQSTGCRGSVLSLNLFETFLGKVQSRATMSS